MMQDLDTFYRQFPGAAILADLTLHANYIAAFELAERERIVLARKRDATGSILQIRPRVTVSGSMRLPR